MILATTWRMDLSSGRMNSGASLKGTAVKDVDLNQGGYSTEEKYTDQDLQIYSGGRVDRT
jgi:hypothetical protein